MNAGVHRGLRIWIFPGVGAGRQLWAFWYGCWELNIETLYEYVFSPWSRLSSPQYLLFFLVAVRFMENIIVAHFQITPSGVGSVTCMWETLSKSRSLSISYCWGFPQWPLVEACLSTVSPPSPLPLLDGFTFHRTCESASSDVRYGLSSCDGPSYWGPQISLHMYLLVWGCHPDYLHADLGLLPRWFWCKGVSYWWDLVKEETDITRNTY